MNLTNEVLEMWEADARRGHLDVTAANARIVRLIEEERETCNLLALAHARLIAVDPEWREAVFS